MLASLGSATTFKITLSDCRKISRLHRYTPGLGGRDALDAESGAWNTKAGQPEVGCISQYCSVNGCSARDGRHAAYEVYRIL